METARQPSATEAGSNSATSSRAGSLPGAPTASAAGRPVDTFRLDVEYTRLRPAFASAGVDSVLLKGPAFDQLLFEGRRSRAYLDIDVLADPAHIPAAERLLEQLGFRRAERRSATRAARRAGMSVGVLRAPHATAWIRHRDRFTLDLHYTLPQIGVSAREAWRALGAHRGTITVVGTHVETLDQPASALLIALHAAHHGPSWNRAQIDLRRACEVLGFDTWHAAALLAGQLRTRTAMGIGLGTVTEGRALARELGLRTRPTWAHRVMWSGIAWRERGRRAG